VKRNTWQRAGVTPIPRGEWFGRVFFAGEGRYCLLGPSDALLISPAGGGGATKRLSFEEAPQFAVFAGDCWLVATATALCGEDGSKEALSFPVMGDCYARGSLVEDRLWYVSEDGLLIEHTLGGEAVSHVALEDFFCFHHLVHATATGVAVSLTLDGRIDFFARTAKGLALVHREEGYVALRGSGDTLVAVCDDVREFDLRGGMRATYRFETLPFLAAKSGNEWIFVGSKTIFRGNGEVLYELEAMPIALFAEPSSEAISVVFADRIEHFRR
jgi:hypothetical protein